MAIAINFAKGPSLADVAGRLHSRELFTWPAWRFTMFSYVYAAMLVILEKIISTYFGATPATDCGLIAANFTPGPTLTLASLTLATFDGYAVIPVTGTTTPHIGSNAQPVANLEPLMSWTPTGTATPNTIWGYYLQNSISPFFGAELFPAPVLMDGPATTLSFVATIGVGPGLNGATILP